MRHSNHGIAAGGPLQMIDSRDAAREVGRESQSANAGGIRQVPLLAAYLIAGVILGLVTLALHPMSRVLSNQLASHLLLPYAAAGALFFTGRAVARDKLRWCRSCCRWLAVQPDGERVVRSRPITRRNHGRLEQFNTYGQRTGYSRSQTTTRGIRETVAITMVCHHCGAKSIVRERRDK